MNVKGNYLTAGAAFLLLVSLIGNGIFLNRTSQLENERNQAILHADSMLAVKLLMEKQCDEARASLDEKNKELDSITRTLDSVCYKMKTDAKGR